jgi:GTPase SAR1 family protein
MKLRSGMVYYSRSGDAPIMTSLDHAVNDPGIVIVYGSGGSGKTALIEQWKNRNPQLIRPDEVVHIYFSEKTSEYRSSTHMVYSRIMEAIDQHHPPAYVPIRKKDRDEKPLSRFGKMNLESLRQKVRQKVTDRFIRVIVLDNVQYATKQAITTAIFQLGCTGGDQEMNRAVVLVGQEEKKWPHWMLDNASTRKHIRDVHEMGPLPPDEYKSVIRYLRDEGLKAIVPDEGSKAQVNQELGELVEATNGNWASLTTLMRVVDEEMPPQPDGSPRHITLNVLERVRRRFEKLNR